MKIVVFGPDRRVGLWQGEYVIDVHNAVCAYLAKKGEPQPAQKAAALAPSDLAAYIAAGPEALDLTRAAAEYAAEMLDPALVHPYSGLKIWAPWPGRRIACAGANYAEHVANFLRNRGQPKSCEEVKAESRQTGPTGFWKVPAEAMGPGDEVIYPSRSTRFDYEAELAVVFGRRGKDIPASQARKHIWGVTLANDWSDRDQIKPSSSSVSLNLMKNFDCSISLGPCILVDDADIQNFDVTLSVNDQERQRYNTKDMIFPFAEYIEFLSRDLTLVPGDILLGGTGAGTAMDMSTPLPDGRPAPDGFLKVGDLVEVGSDRIGSLRNRVAAKD